MIPFCSLQIRYTNKKLTESERHSAFLKIAEHKSVEKSNFLAHKSYSWVLYKTPLDVIQALTRKPQPGILLTVFLDEVSRIYDPNILVLTPSINSPGVKEKIRELGGEIVDEISENDRHSYVCDFGSFHKFAIAYEKLFGHYIIHFKNILNEDLWKFETINDVGSGRLSSSEMKTIMEMKRSIQPPLPKEIDPRTRNSFHNPPPPPAVNSTEERRFRFYIRVKNDFNDWSKVDDFIHELDGYKSTHIMDSRDNSAWRFIRAEFDSDENAGDAYNLMQLFPVETKVHYFIDFLKNSCFSG